MVYDKHGYMHNFRILKVEFKRVNVPIKRQTLLCNLFREKITEVILSFYEDIDIQAIKII